MTSDCCKTGFKWSGMPVGHVGKLASNDTYITGTSKSAAIMIIHDVFGWTLPNVRLLADQYAEIADATVYVPDFFDGEVVATEVFDNPEKREQFDINAFITRHSKDIRFPEMVACATTLKSKYPKVAAVGFCYGGWACFRLAALDPPLVSCISTAHPSLMTKDEIAAVKVPVQIVAPEFDSHMPKEMKAYCNETIPEQGVVYQYTYFPEVKHGFAVRGDREDRVQRESLERAAVSMAGWCGGWLHG